MCTFSSKAIDWQSQSGSELALLNTRLDGRTEIVQVRRSYIDAIKGKAEKTKGTG